MPAERSAGKSSAQPRPLGVATPQGVAKAPNCSLVNNPPARSGAKASEALGSPQGRALLFAPFAPDPALFGGGDGDKKTAGILDLGPPLLQMFAGKCRMNKHHAKEMKKPAKARLTSDIESRNELCSREQRRFRTAMKHILRGLSGLPA